MSRSNPQVVGSGMLLLVLAGLMACGQDGNTPADGDVVPVAGGSSNLAGTGGGGGQSDGRAGAAVAGRAGAAVAGGVNGAGATAAGGAKAEGGTAEGGAVAMLAVAMLAVAHRRRASCWRFLARRALGARPWVGAAATCTTSPT